MRRNHIPLLTSSRFGIIAESLSYTQALLIVGIAVLCAAGLVFAVRFSRATETAERMALDNALAARAGGTALLPGPAPAD